MEYVDSMIEIFSSGRNECIGWYCTGEVHPDRDTTAMIDDYFSQKENETNVLLHLDTVNIFKGKAMNMSIHETINGEAKALKTYNNSPQEILLNDFMRLHSLDHEYSIDSCFSELLQENFNINIKPNAEPILKNIADLRNVRQYLSKQLY